MQIQGLGWAVMEAGMLLPSFSPSVMSDSFWDPMDCGTLSPGVCSNSCPLSQWCYLSPPLLSLLLLPSIFSSTRVFSNESALHIRWPKYCSFSFSLSPSNDYSGLISFRIDWFALLAVQGTLKSLLQHHNLKASILWCSAFFMVQFSSHPLDGCVRMQWLVPSPGAHSGDGDGYKYSISQ